MKFWVYEKRDVIDSVDSAFEDSQAGNNGV